MNNPIKSFVALSVVISLTSGCASIQKGDPARSAELKKFATSSTSAQIYVCRNGSVFGLAIRPSIEIDKTPVATIAASTYAYAELSPGKHVIVAKTAEHDSVMDFTVSATEQKFFQTWIVPGVLSGRAVIDEITPEVGRECVKNGELVEAVIN